MRTENRQALILLLLPILVALIIMVTSIIALRSVIESEDTVVYDHAQDLIHAEKLRSAFEWKVASNRGFYLTKDTLFLTRESAARKEFKDTLQLLKNEVVSPKGKILLRNIDTTEEEHQKAVDLFKDYRKQDDIPKALKAFEEQVYPKREKLRIAIEELTALKLHNFETSKTEAKKDADRATNLVILVAITSLLLTGYLGRVVARKLATAFRNEAFAREKAEDAAHSRMEFLAVASHELRTPLTSLQMQLQMLERLNQKDMPSEQYKKDSLGKLQSALRQCTRLNGLMETLLDVVLLSDDNIKISPAEIDLAEFLRHKAHDLADDCSRMGCELRTDFPNKLMVRVDPTRFGQAIMSLAANAIKYGQGKPIDLLLTKTEKDLRVTVRDYGVGIAKNAHGKIFEKFERAVSAKSISGFGVGLFLAREIVEAHGGSLYVNSDLNQGSTFIISMPLDILVSES